MDSIEVGHGPGKWEWGEGKQFHCGMRFSGKWEFREGCTGMGPWGEG